MEIIIVHLSIFLQNPRPCSLCFNVISCWRSVLFNPNVPMVTLTLSSAFSNALVTSHLDGCLSTFLTIQFSVSFERVLFFVFFFFFFSFPNVLLCTLPFRLSSLPSSGNLNHIYMAWWLYHQPQSPWTLLQEPITSASNLNGLKVNACL